MEKHNERSRKEKWHQMLINAFSDYYHNVDEIEGKGARARSLFEVTV